MANLHQSVDLRPEFLRTFERVNGHGTVPAPFVDVVFTSVTKAFLELKILRGNAPFRDGIVRVFIRDRLLMHNDGRNTFRR